MPQLIIKIDFYLILTPALFTLSEKLHLSVIFRSSTLHFISKKWIFNLISSVEFFTIYDKTDNFRTSVLGFFTL